MNTNPRRLTRRRDDRMIGGVCSGLADYLNADPTLIRLLTAFAALVSGGTVILAYIVAWAVMPEA